MVENLENALEEFGVSVLWMVVILVRWWWGVDW